MPGFEGPLSPLNRRPPTDLTLISCANAAKVGKEPKFTDAARCSNVRFSSVNLEPQCSNSCYVQARRPLQPRNLKACRDAPHYQAIVPPNARVLGTLQGRASLGLSSAGP